MPASVITPTVLTSASLSAQRTSEQLESSCRQIFEVFGKNVVKVKYDKNKHPFALVQFEVRSRFLLLSLSSTDTSQTVDAAVQAIRSNHGAVLDGRTIRLEQGKAERKSSSHAHVVTASDHTTGAVIITRINGAPMTENEVRAILSPFGAIDAMYPTTALRGRPTNLPGFYVRFAFYQDCRDALKVRGACCLTDDM
jgi:uncharacterized protein YkuJ